MPRNVEIKARLADASEVARRAALLADGPAERIEQDDTFFVVPTGRLKLRCFGDGSGELIFYRRPDRSGPKTSDYRIAPCPAPAPLLDALGAALGVLGRVCKVRHLWLCGRTRVHLDAVEGLGSFLELEVVLGPGEDEAGGEREARSLLEALGVSDDDLIAGAYLDLLGERAGERP